jgi:hypothetical protein
MTAEYELLIGLTPALLFFGIIPLAGAFAVRWRWRIFRQRILAAYKWPMLDYSSAHRVGSGTDDTGGVRFLGRLEGIQGDTGIWLGAQGLSVMVDLEKVPIFLLPPSASSDASPPDATPRVVMWKELGAMVEGSRFFVAGCPYRNGSTLTISSWSDGKGRPLVIMYDCPDSIVLDRAIWTGRQRNEYWNHLTPVSLIVGFLAQLLWAMRILDQSRLYALIGTVTSLIPVLPLIPPGVAGFYVYRRLWRRGRRVRASRDMLALRRWQGRQGTSAMTRYTAYAAVFEIFAVAALLTGMIVNGYIAAVVLALILR